MENSNLPAFPASEQDHSAETKGLTKREYFAIKIMQGFLANSYWAEKQAQGMTSDYSMTFEQRISVRACELADTLLYQLNEKK